MQSVRKVSLAIGAKELAWAKKRAGRSRSVSAVVTEALGTARRLEADKEVLAWLFDGRPPPTEDELLRIREEWESPSTPGR